jgi:hypothetical protein
MTTARHGVSRVSKNVNYFLAIEDRMHCRSFQVIAYLWVAQEKASAGFPTMKMTNGDTEGRALWSPMFVRENASAGYPTTATIDGN